MIAVVVGLLVVGEPALAGLVEATFDSPRAARTSTKPIDEGTFQVAQRGRCKLFGQVNKCKPRWVPGTKECKCVGR
jgi:hypothetical protein